MNEKKREGSLFSPWLFLPVAVLILLVVFVLSYGKGRGLEVHKNDIGLVTDEYVAPYCGADSGSGIVVVYDGWSKSSRKIAGFVEGEMDVLRLSYRKWDLRSETMDFAECEHMFFCSYSLESFDRKYSDFVAWLETGDFVWLCPPNNDTRFSEVKGLLGIERSGSDYIERFSDIVFVDDIIPGMKGVTTDGLGMNDSCLKVALKKDCKVSIKEAETKNPLLWDYKTEDRYVTMVNADFFSEKNINNGLMAHVIVKHLDHTVWPIVNSMLIYIDDFPAPQPEGFDERLKDQFGYDTQSFFMNVWWPQMKKMAENYKLKYTGVFVETYSDNMTPPFERGIAEILSRYYGSELINEGGEIAYHGYNHQPLIPEGYPNTDDYLGWPSAENMKIASEGLVSYAKEIFPELTFTSYVPPSNYLSDEGYEVAKEVFKDLKVISGVYYDYEDGTSYHGDYVENSDGIINVPRITSGFSMEAFDEMRLYSSLFDIGVVSHFIHPDDVLDEERGALLGWNAMYESLYGALGKVESLYPDLRPMTATSGGGAVQRFQRVGLNVTDDGDSIKISLTNRYDDVWLAFYSDDEVVSVEGGKINKITDSYYWICCDSDSVILKLA